MKERTFVVVSTGDYMVGDVEPMGNVYKNKLQGAYGIMDAIRRSEIIDKKEYFDEHLEELGVKDKSAEEQYKAVKGDYVNGDGDDCHYLFEMIEGQSAMKLILG